MIQKSLAPAPTAQSDERDLWAQWPDDYMCPVDEIEEAMRSPCARSDDFMRVEVLEYDVTGTPSRWIAT